MPQPATVCLPCRLRLLARLYAGRYSSCRTRTSQNGVKVMHMQQRHTMSRTFTPVFSERRLSRSGAREAGLGRRRYAAQSGSERVTAVGRDDERSDGGVGLGVHGRLDEEVGGVVSSAVDEEFDIEVQEVVAADVDLGVDEEDGSLSDEMVDAIDGDTTHAVDEEGLVEATTEHLRADAPLDTEGVVRRAREMYRDRLPEGALNGEERKVYERLYGLPWSTGSTAHEMEEGEESEGNEREMPALLMEGADGELTEIELRDTEAEELIEEEPGDTVSATDAALQRDIAATNDFEADYKEDPGDVDESEDTLDSEEARLHPFTASNRFATTPTTLSIPKGTLTGPTSVMLADLSNKHLDELSQNLFGGPGLPYSTGTPLSSRQLAQKPIQLAAGQGKMTSMEADVYVAALMPGMYASVMAVLVEVRKRIGAGWLEGLLTRHETGEGGRTQPQGPKILDAGAGGAGVLAWRDMLAAEWERMHEGQASEEAGQVPQGKATVLTGSHALRQRASMLLDNTTFLPRLPDVVHASDDSQKKQFDVIVAPHSLWHLQEDWMRRSTVQNLWSLLNPNGGVLVLLEKGVPRGFEVVAAARDHLLSDLFATESTIITDDSTSSSEDHGATESKPRYGVLRSPGRILAPCTNHDRCPLYTIPGVSKGRKDFCHFAQRYVRPHYYQRMLGARDRNHEDVEFSYVVVQKGSLPGTEEVTTTTAAGRQATERAFQGYDVDHEDLRQASAPNANAAMPNIPASTIANSSPAEQEYTYHVDAINFPSNIALPRLVLPPLKRKGHVILDVCTPHGTIERWTVPRSFGQQAYRDARKSRWGDLWALGAKTRIPRNLKLGRADEGVVRDVWGRSRVAGDGRSGEVAADVGAQSEKNGKGWETDKVSRTKERVVKRREEKVRGREKARARRRSETKLLMMAG